MTTSSRFVATDATTSAIIISVSATPTTPFQNGSRASVDDCESMNVHAKIVSCPAVATCARAAREVEFGLGAASESDLSLPRPGFERARTNRARAWSSDGVMYGESFNKCVGCSPKIVDQYEASPKQFLLEACNNANYLEDLTGITAMNEAINLDDIEAFDDIDFD